MQEMQVWSLVQEDPLEKEMATDSSVLSWEILWTEKSGGLQSVGLQRVRYDLATRQQQQQQSLIQYQHRVSWCSKPFLKIILYHSLCQEWTTCKPSLGSMREITLFSAWTLSLSGLWSPICITGTAPSGWCGGGDRPMEIKAEFEPECYSNG